MKFGVYHEGVKYSQWSQFGAIWPRDSQDTVLGGVCGEGGKLFLKFIYSGKVFLLTERDWARTQINAPRSQTLESYRNRVHGTHQPMGENQFKMFLEKEFAFPVRYAKACMPIHTLNVLHCTCAEREAIYLENCINITGSVWLWRYVLMVIKSEHHARLWVQIQTMSEIWGV